MGSLALQMDSIPAELPGKPKFEAITVQISQTDKQREQRVEKKRERISKDSGTTTKDVTHIMGVTEREEREKGIEETFETTMAENFPQLIKPEIQEVQRATA